MIVLRPLVLALVVLHEAGQKLLQARGGRHVLLSLSHTRNYAAVAILEGGSQAGKL
jgi:hypothetical protein